jgi:ferredoxin
MKVSVDADLCTGCGLCADNVPEVFEMQGDIAVTKRSSVEDPLTDKVRDAANDCPVEAILTE